MKYWENYCDEYLNNINGVNFTERELDIICVVLNGRLSKTIATSLGIAPKTAETHLYNVMRKIGCHSKEGIINFIEHAEAYEGLNRRYKKRMMPKA